MHEWALLIGAVGLLLAATLTGRWLHGRDSPALDRRTIEAFNARVHAWWFLGGLVVISFFYPRVSVTIFGLLSFWALREFVTLTPTRGGDHRALFWVFFFFTPMQFVLVGFDNYGLYSVLIPVYAFLFIAARVAFSGDFESFLERVAKVQSGLMLCVYCLSFAPALLFLRCRDMDREFANAMLLFFFITIALVADLFQFIWNRLYGRHVIAPRVDALKTWEGVLGGAASAAVVGAALSWATPFPHWYQAAAMSLLIAVMASAGSMTMLVIKRDRGEPATGNLVEGHGGVLSRIDGICFAAPVFYHVTRYFFGVASG